MSVKKTFVFSRTRAEDPFVIPPPNMFHINISDEGQIEVVDSKSQVVEQEFSSTAGGGGTFTGGTTNGTAGQTSVDTWWRVNRVEVMTAGSNNGAVGNLTVRHTSTTANVFAVMPGTFNQSTIAAYTVPADKRMIIKRVRASITRANGSAGSATLSLRVRELGSNVYRSIRVFEIQTGAAAEYTAEGGDVLEAGTDIKFRCDQVSDSNTIAEAAFEYVLINGINIV